MTTEKLAINPEEIAEDVGQLKSLIAKYQIHFGEGAHLITAVGAIRTAIQCFDDHISAKAKAVAQPES